MVSSARSVVRSVLRSSRFVGFSGSRSVVPEFLSQVVEFVVAEPGSRVFVGCARGVDAAVRSGVPSERLSVFRVRVRSRSGFAERSVRFVRELARVGGVLVSFPGRACPSVVSPSSDPSACFCGSGSGSWASLAFARGLGVRCVVWLPVGVVPPSAFGLRSVGSGWWLS